MKSFCFRFSLRSGAIAAAVNTALGLIGVLISGITLVWYAAYLNSSSRYWERDYPPYEAALINFWTCGIIFMIIFVCKLITLIFLCLGINRNRASMVYIWLVWTVIEIILLPVVIISTAILLEYWWAFLSLIYVICMIYLYCATHSYYKDLTEGLLRPSPL